MENLELSDLSVSDYSKTSSDDDARTYSSTDSSQLERDAMSEYSDTSSDA